MYSRAYTCGHRTSVVSARRRRRGVLLFRVRSTGPPLGVSVLTVHPPGCTGRRCVSIFSVYSFSFELIHDTSRIAAVGWRAFLCCRLVGIDNVSVLCVVQYLQRTLMQHAGQCQSQLSGDGSRGVYHIIFIYLPRLCVVPAQLRHSTKQTPRAPCAFSAPPVHLLSDYRRGLHTFINNSGWRQQSHLVWTPNPRP